MRRTLRELAGVAVALAVVCVAGCKGDQGPAGPPGPQGPSGGTVSNNPDPNAPNLNLAVTKATVNADRKVVVEYKLTDAGGAGVASANDVSSSWTLAVLSKDPANGIPAWQSLILGQPVTGANGTTQQPTSESNGTTENLGGGNYRYTYATALPQGFDQAATYRTGVYQRRPIPNSNNLNDVTNGVLDFVPSGGTPAPHDMVALSACNACHTQLRAHGGFRRETRLCATCHTTQLIDPDTADTGDPTKPNPLEFGRMVHRIHRGEALPTVEAAAAANDTTWKYHVIGFRNSDNVYGEVRKNPNPASGQPPAVTAGVAFPRDLRGCAVCHQPQKDAQGNVVYAAQADEWKTNVSRRTCQSCHDSSWFQDPNPPKYHLLHQRATNPTNTGVTGLVQADDSACKTCHSDVLMAQHHTSPFASSAFNPLQLAINSVTVTTAPGAGSPGAAQVSFTITNAKDGSPVTDLSTLSSASLNGSQLDKTSNDFESSATDKNIATKNVIGTTTIPRATPVPGQPGTYTDTIALPAGATGTWAVGMEARRVNQTLTAQERKLGNLGPTATFNEFAPVNPVMEFDTSKAGTAQTSKTLSRRKVVEVQRCNVCHETLSVHGGLRHSPEYCVMCHTPNNTDVARRPKNAGGAPEDPNATNTAATLDKLAERSIHLKAMIHSIHTGEELSLQRPFVIYGFGNTPNFLDEVRFPTSRANCQICHLSGTNTLDSLREDALPTHSMQQGQAVTDASGNVTTGGTIADVPPIQAACLACHDNPEAHAHATVMTQVPTGAPAGAPKVETCRICHAENSDFAVTKMHRQAASRDE